MNKLTNDELKKELSATNGKLVAGTHHIKIDDVKVNKDKFTIKSFSRIFKGGSKS